MSLSTETPWSQLVSTDLREYAARLRAAGCPAETVCDLIRAESKRVLKTRSEAAFQHTNFWLSGSERKAHERGVRGQIDQWGRERDQLLAELACATPWPEDDEGDGTERIVEVIAGFMPPDRKLALLQIVRDCEDFKKSWREKTEGILLPADLKRLEAESARMMDRIRQEVGEAEFEEACLRGTTALAGLFSNSDVMGAIQITPQEVRELTRQGYLAGENDIRRELNLASLVKDDQEAHPSRTEDQTRADNRAVLGEAREQELHVRTAPSYSTTESWVKQYNLPNTTSASVLHELDTFRADMRLMSDLSGSPESTKGYFQDKYRGARGRLETILATVPEKERNERIQQWLQVQARGALPP